MTVAVRLRAARHEVRCGECRVTWKSWAQRLLGFRAGYSPGTHLPTDAELDKLEAAGCDDRMIQRIVDQRFEQHGWAGES